MEISAKRNSEVSATVEDSLSVSMENNNKKPRRFSESSPQSVESVVSGDGGDLDQILHSGQTVEDVFKICGDAGRWQFIVYFLAAFGGIPSALQDFIYIFIAAQPAHWCALPECQLFSEEHLKNASIPLEYVEDKYDFAKCSRYHLSDPGGFNDTCTSGLSNNLTNFYNQSYTESCSSNDFDHDVFSSTIVTQWNLVCGDEYLASTSQAVYAIGSLTGSLIFGIVSDNYGRKKAILGSALISTILGPAVAFAPSYTIFIVARFFLAVGSPGMYDIAYILAVEMMGPDWRGLAGNAFGIPYAIGYSLTAGFAYLFRNWRILQLVLSIPPLLYLLAVFFFVPESPRWLISQGKGKDAEKVFRSIAKTNGRSSKLPPNFSEIIQRLCGQDADDAISSEKTDKPGKNCGQSFAQFFTTFSQLFRTPKMRMRTLVLNFCWVSTVLVYYGVVLNAPNLSADLFIYTILSGLLEIPSFLMVPLLLKYVGRRFVFSGLLFITGVCLGVSLFFEPGSVAIVTLALLGMFFVGAAYALIFLYGIELMPTSLRTYGIGSAAITGKIGTAGAPYITGLLGNYNKKSPAMIFTAVSFVASLCSLLLPETRNKPLPETVQDVENS